MSPLQQLIDEINFQRAKEMRQMLKDDSGFVLVHGTAFWTDLFVRHFIFEQEEDTNCQEQDDLLFFIRKRHQRTSKKYLPRFETTVEVFRRDNKRLPVGDPEIDWQETVYTNLIIHRFNYYATLAVCTRTSPKQLQILKRHTERVWASPSRRSMSEKGTSEQITYPNICFMLDNFEQVFSDLIVRDGETIAVELVARDTSAGISGVIFLGSVRYDTLKRVYDSRVSACCRMAYRMSFGLFASASSRRMEFVRLSRPGDRGHAEMAITKPAGVSSCETPVSEPGFSLTDQWDSDVDAGSDCENDETSKTAVRWRSHQRRSSDPSATLQAFLCSAAVGGGGSARADSSATALGRARSESDGLNTDMNTPYAQVESGDLRDACVTVTADKSVAACRLTSCDCCTDNPVPPGTDAACQSPLLCCAGTLYRWFYSVPERTTETALRPINKCMAGEMQLNDRGYNPIWTMRGHMQTFHCWKESRRQASTPLNALLTYIMLPCSDIVHELLCKETRQKPILTF